jgi:hypothetical protein
VLHGHDLFDLGGHRLRPSFVSAVVPSHRPCAEALPALFGIVARHSILFLSGTIWRSLMVSAR